MYANQEINSMQWKLCNDLHMELPFWLETDLNSQVGNIFVQMHVLKPKIINLSFSQVTIVCLTQCIQKHFFRIRNLFMEM